MRSDYKRARSDTEKADRQRKILVAAEAQLVESGWKDFTIGKVASRAGVAKGTLYLYFETKEAVLDAVIVDRLTSWSSALAEAAHEGVTDASFCAAYWDLTESDLVMTTALMGLLSDPGVSEEHVFSMMRARIATLTPLTRHLEQCLALPRGAGSQVLTGLWALLTGLAQMDWSRLKPELSPSAVPDDVAGLFKMIDSKALFLRFAPALIESTRSES